jgi:serine/threonine-protein kinase RsbW
MAEPRDRRTAGTATFETPADLSSLAVIREFVADACRRLAAPPDAITDLVQAVDEAATNITLHGYKGFPGPVEITVTRDRDRLTVTLRDEAPPFDPTSVGPPDLSKPLEERSIGGLGIHLMRSFTDAMIYRRLPGGGNELALVKDLPLTPS